jgi:hypothetical protein
MHGIGAMDIMGEISASPITNPSGAPTMKRAVSVSLGSPKRDKRVEITLDGERILLERIGTGGDVQEARHLFATLDDEVDAFGVGGVDLYLRLEGREYPLHAALKLVQDVHQTPIVDGRGLKHTLERRVFELAGPAIKERPHFHRSFIPVAVDRLGLATAVTEVSDQVIFGDLMVALGIPISIKGINNFRKIARILLPIVSHFPMSLLFYGSSGDQIEPKYERFWAQSDLIAGDFLFMRKHMPPDLTGKWIITNTTTAENIELLRVRGVRTVITTTPQYEGRSFGTNMLEAALTAYAAKGRPLRDDELNELIDQLNLKPTVLHLN